MHVLGQDAKFGAIEISMKFTRAELELLQYQQAVYVGSPAAPGPQDDFVITRAWLDAHTCRTGFWTPRQLAAIGVEYPPRRGWLAKIEGSTITQTSRLIFESYSK